MGDNVDLLERSLPHLVERLEASIERADGRMARSVFDGELVYSPSSTHSHYRDLMALRGFVDDRSAETRLARHAEQMANIAAARRDTAVPGFEFRVEPNITEGQGGYFAPPAWLNALFATGNRPRRVLADLMQRFPLPTGFASVSVPMLATGTVVQQEEDDSGVPDQDIVDQGTTSAVVPLAGQTDIAVQLLDLSPVPYAIDWAIFMDLAEATDADLEQQLIYGAGGSGANAQLLGVLNVLGIGSVVYTDSTPTGAEMMPFIGQTMAKVGNTRLLPPECWLVRTSRWAWLQTSEDTSAMPFGAFAPFYLGDTDSTPDPIGPMVSLPAFPDDAIPATLSASTTSNVTTYGIGTQDVIIALRPTELPLFEGEPVSMVTREPLSGAMGVRIQSHVNVAALTGRRPASIAVLSGTGMTIQSGW